MVTSAPDVDRLLSSSPAQSESEYAISFMLVDVPAWKISPSVFVEITYRRIRFTASQWLFVGLATNLDAWLTANAMSGLVVRLMIPTAALYGVLDEM